MTNGTSVCSFKTYFQCAFPILESASSTSGCSCEERCTRRRFRASASQANLDAAQFDDLHLTEDTVTNIRQTLTQMADIRDKETYPESRVLRPATRRRFFSQKANMLEELIDATKRLQTGLMHDPSVNVFNSIKRIHENISSAVDQHLQGFQNMKKLYDQGFLRHFKVFFHDISVLLHTRFIELLNQIRMNLQNYLRCFHPASRNEQSLPEKKIHFLLSMRSGIDDIKHLVTNVKEACLERTRRFSDVNPFEVIQLETHNEFARYLYPRELITNTYKEYLMTFSSDISAQMDTIYGAMEDMQKLLPMNPTSIPQQQKTGLLNVITHMNRTLYEVASPSHFQSAIRRLERIASDVSTQESRFLETNAKLEKALDAMGRILGQSLQSSHLRASSLATNSLYRLQHCASDFQSSKQSFTHFSDCLLDASVERLEVDVQSVTREFRATDAVLRRSFNDLTPLINNVWKHIFVDDNLLRQFHLATRLFKDDRRNLGRSERQVESLINDVIRAAEISPVIQNYDDDFVTSLQFWRTRLQTRRDRVATDATFVRDNIIKVDVFFNDLSYLVSVWKKRSSFFSLLRDMFLPMPLFLGASLLSIVEILDFILTAICSRAICQQKEK